MAYNNVHGADGGDLGINDDILQSQDSEFCDGIAVFNEKSRDYASTNYLKVFATNICSCRRNFPQLEVFLNSVYISFHFIILTEIFLSPDTDNSFNIQGYSSYNKFRNNLGGGLKILVKNCISATVIPELSFIDRLYECLCLSFSYSNFWVYENTIKLHEA